MRALDLFTGVVPFVVVAEARSFRAAARELGVTPSALSKSISKLEEELSVRLLHRTSRSVTLTTEGETFLLRCRDAVDQVRAAREVVSLAQRGPRGHLRVSLPLPLAHLVVMPALPRLLARHPALSVQAIVTDRYVDLVKENVDVVIRIGTREDSRLVARRLRTARWTTVASPSYLARRGTPKTPDELAHHNCLKFVGPNGIAREWIFRAAPARARAGSPPPVETFESVATSGNLMADHGDALVQAAAAGGGVVQALDFMVKAELAHGDLVEILRDAAAPGPEITALTAAGRTASPKVRAFVAFMVEAIAAGSIEA